MAHRLTPPPFLDMSGRYAPDVINYEPEWKKARCFAVLKPIPTPSQRSVSAPFPHFRQSSANGFRA